MKPWKCLSLLLLLILVPLLASQAGAVSTLCGFDCLQDCAGACGGGIVSIVHFGQGFLDDSGFDLRGTSYGDSCNDPTLPNGCPVKLTPPLRFWAWNHFNGANNGCKPLFDAATGNSSISSSYDLGNGRPPGIWYLEQAQWAGPTTAGPLRIDGCIGNAIGNPLDRRTVAEISYTDPQSNDGTVRHDSYYLIAGAAENNSGNTSYDFEEITGANGDGNRVPATSVPDVINLLNAVQGSPDCSSSGSPTTHPRNAVNGAYFDVTLQVSDAAPQYFNEEGRNLGAPLIAGLQVMYMAGFEPTSSIPAVAGWVPARYPLDPFNSISALIPHGGASTIVVSLPVAQCSAGCWLAARVVYQDDSMNPGMPGPVGDISAPRLVSLTGQHCGPVQADSGGLPDLYLTKAVVGPNRINPGAGVVFDIRLKNVGSAPHSGATLGDTLPACVEPLGFDGLPCPATGSASVTCTGSGCASTQCTISNQGRGFLLSGISLAASDGLPGGGDEIAITVRAVAGSTHGPCQNVAAIIDPVDGVISATADFWVVRPWWLYWMNALNGSNAAWEFNAQYQLRSAFYLPSVFDLAWRGAAAGDLDGNQAPDVVWRHRTQGWNAMWTVYSPSQVVPSYLPSLLAPETVIADAVDINRDGKDDLLWRNTQTGQNAVWYMSGGAVVGSASLPSVPDLAWELVAAGDFNGDQSPDLLWWYRPTGDVALWYMSGTVRVGTASIGRVATNWEPVGIVDADGDLDADIVWRESVSGANVLWIMNGAVHFDSVWLPALIPQWYLGGAY